MTFLLDKKKNDSKSQDSYHNLICQGSSAYVMHDASFWSYEIVLFWIS